MQKNELIKQLHTLTIYEKYLKEHQLIRYDSNLISEFNKQLSPEEANRLLVPLIPVPFSKEPPKFTMEYFLKAKKDLKIKMIQHTRYSTPVVHTHDFYEIFYVVEGDFEQFIDNKKIQMKSGDVCIIQPGIFHSLNVENNSIILNVLIDSQTFGEVTNNSFLSNGDYNNFFMSEFFSSKLKNYIIFRTSGDEEIKNLFLTMNLELINKKKNYAQVVPSLLMIIFSLLLRNYIDTIIKSDHPNKQNSLDLEIITEIEHNYQNMSLDILAEKFNYTPQYISRRIKELTGVSFATYLKQHRLSIAKLLLFNSNKSISEISQALGYSNVETFIRLIKREYNQTPLQLRKNERKINK